MKVLIIGSTGTIGSAILNELKKDTDIITASFSGGDIQVDLTDATSIKALYKKAGPLDAVICAAARGVIFKKLPEMTRDDYVNSMQSKLIGQMDVVLQGQSLLNSGGSFTLTTGTLNRDPITGGSAAAMVNNAVEAFVSLAALELPNQLRINVVSPALLTESAKKYEALFPGFETVAAEKVARAYRKSVYGIQTGRVYHVD
jgi:NAD(P)-dependent dehydrogenase (short-subunit alcohol dehydrogenase family)